MTVGISYYYFQLTMETCLAGQWLWSFTCKSNI